MKSSWCSLQACGVLQCESRGQRYPLQREQKQVPTWCKIKDVCGEEGDPASLLVVPEELVSRADEIVAQIACDDVLSGIMIAGQDEPPDTCPRRPFIRAPMPEVRKAG